MRAWLEAVGIGTVAGLAVLLVMASGLLAHRLIPPPPAVELQTLITAVSADVVIAQALATREVLDVGAVCVYGADGQILRWTKAALGLTPGSACPARAVAVDFWRYGGSR